jgi:2,5-furandicarboxylate decarboxylase 1
MTTLRQWIEDSDRAGILRRVKKETDVRKVSSILNEDRTQPVLFEDLIGYEAYLIGQTISSPELVAFALGVEADPQSIGEEYGRRVSNLIEPVHVEEAPCQEVVSMGEEVDLTKLPIPLQHSLDGAPYVSSGIDVVKDPGTFVGPEGVLNLGMYRNMIYTKNLMGIDFVSPQRTNIMYKKLLEEGNPLEMATVIGVHPLAFMAAVAPRKDIEVMGALLDRPVELVKCKTLELNVPADAEIILETKLLPVGWTVPEGPYGEFTGYQSARKENPVVKVTAITHRKNPIYQTVTIGTKHHANSDTANIGLAQSLYKEPLINSLKSTGYDVRGIGSHMGFTIISMKKWFEGQARRLIYEYGSTRSHYPKFLIVVDDDIDVNDPSQIAWAITNACNPESDTIIKTCVPAKPLDPSNKMHHFNTVSSQMGFDATRPLPPYREKGEWIISTVPFEEEILEGREEATGGMALDALADDIFNTIREEPLWYLNILKRWEDYTYRSIMLAMSKLYAEGKILQDEEGKWEVLENPYKHPTYNILH